MVKRALVSIGIGGTAVLIASVVGFAVVGSDFPSVFYVLPFALLAAIITAVGTYLAFGSELRREVRSGLTGMASFSYAYFALWFVRYSIAATREALSFGRIALLSVLVAAAVAAIVWFSDSTVKEP